MTRAFAQCQMECAKELQPRCGDNGSVSARRPPRLPLSPLPRRMGVPAVCLRHVRARIAADADSTEERVSDSTLNFNVFTAPAKPMIGERPRPFGPPQAWDPMTATLIYGQDEAVLVDTLTTTSEAEALADWVRLHHRNLIAIYITHGHLDHAAGLGVLMRGFPEARAIATPGTVQLIEGQIPRQAMYRRMFPGQFPSMLTLPEPYQAGTFTLEGAELHIIEQGRTDCPDSTSLYVPSIDLVVAGDVVYNRCHMFVGATTPESRDEWIRALDHLAALEPTTVVAGHKKPGAPDTPDAVAATKRYLTDFGRLKDSTCTDQELFDAMTDLYPDWVSHQAWLMFGL